MFVSWKPAFSNTLMLLAFMMFLLGETKWALSVHSVNIILAISACRITSALLTEKWKINFLISEEVKGITCKVQELQHNELCSYLMYSIHMYRHIHLRCQHTVATLHGAKGTRNTSFVSNVQCRYGNRCKTFVWSNDDVLTRLLSHYTEESYQCGAGTDVRMHVCTSVWAQQSYEGCTTGHGRNNDSDITVWKTHILLQEPTRAPRTLPDGGSHLPVLSKSVPYKAPELALVL